MTKKLRTGSIDNFFYSVGKPEHLNPLSEQEVDHAFRELYTIAAR